jgi:ceramide glucosyltransferase
MRYSIICPLCESDDLLPVTLDALFHLNCQDYEVLFAADVTAYAAIAVAETVRQRYPATPSQIISDSIIAFVNPKLNNIHKAWLIARGEWIVMVDCNVLLPTDAIDRLETRWDATTGMVCSPPLGTQPGNFWAEVECAYLNTFQAKWQLLADRFGRGFVQGKVMFCNKNTFAQLGGLVALDQEPCEDAAATHLLRRAGLHIHLVTTPFAQPLGRRSLKQVWNRQVRWAKLRRSTFPLLYAAELFVTPVPLLIALTISPNRLFPLGFTVACYGIELAIAKYRHWHLSWRQPLAMMVRDGLAIGVWCVGWFGQTFHWAGRELMLSPGDDYRIIERTE